MNEDRELQTWREEWRRATEPLPEFRAKVKRQSRRFLISNMIAVAACIGAVVLAVFAVRQEPSPERIAWAIGLCVMAVGGIIFRMRNQRGLWRPAAETTRAFTELYRNRAVAKMHAIRVASWLVVAWIIFCGGIVVWRWKAMGPEFTGNPGETALLLGIILGMVLGAGGVLKQYYKRKESELEEANRLQEELKE